MTYSVDIDIFEPTDTRLGRHVHHDSRNRQFAFRAEAARPKAVLWSSALPISDQGAVGACTGFTALDILGYEPYWSALGEGTKVYVETNMGQLGQLFYHTATVLDSIPGQWQPNDTGSDGPSAAKAGVKLGYFSGYVHSFTAKAFDAALQGGPVMVGTVWYESMMTPVNGQLKVDPGSGVAGGHEYLIDGYSEALDAYRMRNHWTADWGVSGFAWIDRTDFLKILKDQGDATVPIPLNAPKPTPTPTPPAPPSPKPDPVDADVFSAYASLKLWATRKGVT